MKRLLTLFGVEADRSGEGLRQPRSWSSVVLDCALTDNESVQGYFLMLKERFKITQTNFEIN